MGLLYKEISSKIENEIRSGKYSSSKLPTEREYSIKYNVSRQTIRKALEECERIGLIQKRQGSGIYLSDAFQRSVNKCALMVPFCDEYVYPRFISELESRMNSINYSLNVFEYQDNMAKEKEILERLLTSPVSTLIVSVSRNSLPTPFFDKYKQLSLNGTNIIFIGNPYPNINEFSYIKFDDFYSGYNSAKRIKNTVQNWCAIYAEQTRDNLDRYYGFVQCMADNNYEFDEENIHWIKYDDLMQIRRYNNITCIRNILDSYTVTPNIIIGGTDDITYSCIMHLKNTRKINEDISFYTFENSYIRSLSDIPMHSFNGDKGMLYSKIIELTLKGTKKEKEVITLPSSLSL